jgi:carboxylesterase
MFPHDSSKPFCHSQPDEPFWEASILETLTGDDAGRLRLARSLADSEYHHPECEKAGSHPGQRSFCFSHDRITDQSVLLIHGWTACPYEMRELGERFYQQGRNVVGTRLAGHGTTTADFGRTGRNDWMASAQKGLGTAALLGREVVVIGESMGGALGALLAKDYPRLVQRLVLCAPCFEIATPLARFTKFRLVRLFLPRHDFGSQPEWMRGYWYQAIPTIGVAELVRVSDQARRAGPLIQAPTLILQADNDAMVNPAGARRFLDSMTGLAPGQKQLLLFPNGHHNLTVDLNPRKTEVFDWIFDFCD